MKDGWVGPVEEELLPWDLFYPGLSRVKSPQYLSPITLNVSGNPDPGGVPHSRTVRLLSDPSLTQGVPSGRVSDRYRRGGLVQAVAGTDVGLSSQEPRVDCLTSEPPVVPTLSRQPSFALRP